MQKKKKYAKKYAKYASNIQVLMILPYIECNMQNAKKICTLCKICKRHFQYAEYALATLLMKLGENLGTVGNCSVLDPTYSGLGSLPFSMLNGRLPSLLCNREKKL
jgi:hypothetical protein